MSRTTHIAKGRVNQIRKAAQARKNAAELKRRRRRMLRERELQAARDAAPYRLNMVMQAAEVGFISLEDAASSWHMDDPAAFLALCATIGIPMQDGGWFDESELNETFEEFLEMWPEAKWWD